MKGSMKQNVWTISAVLFFALVLTVAVFAAGTVTDTYIESMGNPRVMTLAFSNITGTGTNDTSISGTTKSMAGEIRMVTVRPSIGTNVYVRMTLKDSNGVDLFSGLGLTVAVSNTVTFSPAILFGTSDHTTSNAYPVPFNGKLTFAVSPCLTNAVTPCTGVVDILYYAP